MTVTSPQAGLAVVKAGFLPLYDCAALVVAAERGFGRRYGIEIVLSRETSWARVRDRLCKGELDAAHVLYGLMYGVEMGIGGQAMPMAVLMNLSRNGQAITLSRALVEQGATDGAALAQLMRAQPRQYVFAQTFPTGNHAMLLYYWLAAHGIDPFGDARAITISPPQMASSLRAGSMDGFCAGEPWGQRAVADGSGVTIATSGQVWQDHPGKVLGTTAAFAERHPDRCRALVAATLDASRWIEASPQNRREAAELLSAARYLNLPAKAMPGALALHAGGEANFPYLSDGMWFMTQHRRWGLLRGDPDYLAVAGRVNRIDLYRQAAEMAGVALPAGALRASTLIDGVPWDGSDPAAYAASFAIHRIM
ncbi:MAG: CmpA/NrtA family ABC transporter substrate-binding protein [Pseudomonadota bacterium]